MCSRFREAVLAAVVLLGSCARESGPPARGARVEGNRQSELQPGPATAMRPARNPYEANDETIADGKRLYDQFNCSGCHAAGGGAIGPPLMDDEWIYGSGAQNIFWTIVEGRPQGMPSFGGRIADDQIWKITAFVRSLSGIDKREEEQAAAPPEEDIVKRGAQVFLNGPCATCHTVRGTQALGRIGPDLTHLASRHWIAAGALPNTKGHLAGWILNPQNLKPGSKMPPTAMSSRELQSLVAFLQSLR